MKAKLFLILIVLFFVGRLQANTWTPLEYPGATKTLVSDISGNNIVGYWSTNNAHGAFLYNGATWTNIPTGSAIDGDNIVGGNTVYNIRTQNTTILNHPGAIETGLTGISGDNIVGWYMDASFPFTYHGFVYNIVTQNWMTLDYPGGNHTEALSISGNNVVGLAQGSLLDTCYFLYNEGTWTNLPIEPSGIDGDNVVGGNILYNIANQSTTILNYAGALNTNLKGISGNNIVGRYTDSPNNPHSFIYTIPEPSMLLILGLGGLLLRKNK